MQSKTLSGNDRAVLAALDGAERPLSAYEILEKARSGSFRAPTQVYRSLQKLEGQGLVHRIEALSAFVTCSARHDDQHRPAFVICRGCNSVREFQSPKISTIAREAAGPEFSVEAVSLEIFGRCASCNAGSAAS